MTDENTFEQLFGDADPQVEAQKQLWEALATLGVTGDHAELIRVALRIKDPEKIRAGLEAMMHPSAFAERDFARDD